jgi:hypothetical protein
MVILDFSKAFDKVPHRRLMSKLHNYGIRGNTHTWIQNFLIDRHQRVVVDGETSEWVGVKSGVPQGTVLGPVLFLAFINDLPLTVESHVRLFADDCVIYRPVRNADDCQTLQTDLARLENWENSWCMSFNATKCSSISITRKTNKIDFPYTLHNTTLEEVSSATYLGVELSSNLKWSDHINKTVKKGNKQLAFVKRNLPIKNSKLKETAYFGLVRPILEYCCTVWDPHHTTYISKLEMVQRRAARFTLNRYERRSSVTDMLKELQWDSLEQRRARIRATLFYKIQHSLVAIQPPSFIIPNPRFNPDYPHRIFKSYHGTHSYRNSFFPRTITTWNSLPPSIACSPTLDLFKGALETYTF